MTSEEERAKEIICQWAGTDISSQPMENLIQAVAAALAENWIEGCQAGTDARYPRLEAEAAALRQQIGRLQVEREEMKQTYESLLSDFERDYFVVRDNLLKSERRVAELEATQHSGLSTQDLNTARIEGLRMAAKICLNNVWASQAKFDIDAEIAALERGTTNHD